jgi:Peptidase_C39 like family
MPVVNDLVVPYHQQDTDYYCGAACAQMVLGSLGLGLLSQDTLYNDNRTHSTLESGWATAPDGLHWTLTNYSQGLPHAIPSNPGETVNWTTLAYHMATSEDAISRKICWTIEHYTIAPTALVYGSDHWIVVRGYSADRAPTNVDDLGFSIDHFYVNNPWPPTPSASNSALAPPPPHSAGDGCGTGGTRGIANEVIAYSDWTNTYMTGVPSGYFQGKFIAMCDPNPPSTQIGVRKVVRRPFDGDGLVPATRVGELAIAGIRGAGLLENEGIWRRTLANARPGRAELVQRLDRPDSYYYIVPMDAEGRMVSASRIDAKDGLYLGSVVEPPELAIGRAAGSVHRLFPSDDQARSAAIGARLDLGQSGFLKVRPEAVFVYPTLVWEPCLESLSPYYPFRMVILGAFRLFVRVDGRVYTHLTTDIRGV